MDTKFFSRGGSPVDKVYDVDAKRGTASYRYFKTCGRCGGAGGSEAWRYTGYTCFDCGGTGGYHTSAKAYTAEKLAKLDAARTSACEKRDAKRRAAAEARLAEKRKGFEDWLAANAFAVAAIRVHSEGNRFLTELEAKLDDGQVLSDRALDVAIGGIMRDYASAEAKDASQYIGELGKRIELTLTIDRVLQFDSNFGAYYITIGSDGKGNRVVYKGSRTYGEKGDSLRVRATVKDHELRNGSPKSKRRRQRESTLDYRCWRQCALAPW